jgi:hypothetical protein
MQRISCLLAVLLGAVLGVTCAPLRAGTERPGYGKEKPFTVVLPRLAGDADGRLTRSLARELLELDRRLGNRAVNVVITAEELACFRASDKPSLACHRQAQELAAQHQAEATFWGTALQPAASALALYWSLDQGGHRPVLASPEGGASARTAGLSLALARLLVETTELRGTSDTKNKLSELGRELERALRQSDTEGSKEPPAALRALLGSVHLALGVLGRDALTLERAAEELARSSSELGALGLPRHRAQAALLHTQALVERAALEESVPLAERALGAAVALPNAFDAASEPADHRAAARLLARAEHRKGVVAKAPDLVRAARQRLTLHAQNESPGVDLVGWLHTQLGLCETLTDVALLDGDPEALHQGIGRCQGAIEVAGDRQRRFEGHAFLALGRAWLELASIADDPSARRHAAMAFDQVATRFDPALDYPLIEFARALAREASALPPAPCAVPPRLPSGVARLEDFERSELPWYTYKHDSGAMFGTAVSGGPAAANHGELEGSTRAARVYSRGVKGYGIGLGFNGFANGCADVRSFRGLSFHAKRGVLAAPELPSVLSVEFPVPETMAREVGGTCTKVCFDHHQTRVTLTDSWQRFTVSFAELKQNGFGEPAKLTLERVLAVQFVMPGSEQGLPSDFWVDNLELVP